MGFLSDVSDLRRMGETGVESSSTATEFIDVIDVSMNAWVGGPLVVVCFTGGETGVDILYDLSVLFVSSRRWVEFGT